MSGFDDVGEPALATAPLPDGWSEKNGGECRSCHAPIRWARNEQSGRMSPFDLDGKSHFATCPNADDFRKPRAGIDFAAEKSAPQMRQPSSGGGSGAAAAVAVVEAARRVYACRLGRPLPSEPFDDLKKAIDDFDRAMGVSR